MFYHTEFSLESFSKSKTFVTHSIYAILSRILDSNGVKTNVKDVKNNVNNVTYWSHWYIDVYNFIKLHDIYLAPSILITFIHSCKSKKLVIRKLIFLTFCRLSQQNYHKIQNTSVHLTKLSMNVYNKFKTKVRKGKLLVWSSFWTISKCFGDRAIFSCPIE